MANYDGVADEVKKRANERLSGNKSLSIPDDGSYHNNPVTDSIFRTDAGRPGGSARGVDGKIQRTSGRALGTSDLSGGEILRWMPEGFVSAWERLLLMAYTDSAMLVHSSGSGRDIGIVGTGKGSGGLGALKSETPDVRDVYRSGGGGAGISPSPLRNETALAYKDGVERKLRKLGREIKYFVDKTSKGDGNKPIKPQRKCSGRCRRFGDGDWMWCPWCGAAMAEMD